MRALRAKPQIDAAVEFVELMGAPFKEGKKQRRLR